MDASHLIYFRWCSPAGEVPLEDARFFKKTIYQLEGKTEDIMKKSEKFLSCFYSITYVECSAKLLIHLSQKFFGFATKYYFIVVTILQSKVPPVVTNKLTLFKEP